MREIGSVTRNALGEAPFQKMQVGGDERYQGRPDAGMDDDERKRW